MRHRKSGRKLKRTASHRKALLISLATALIRSKRIRTTVAKAKEARMFVEPLITRAKNAVATETAEKKDVHARRMISKYIKDREVVTELFSTVAPKVATRAGGYTRVIKLGQRHGDAAEVAILELVDFNAETMATKKPKTKKKKEETKETTPVE